MKEEINREFGNKLRVRVCGILISNDELLLIRHEGLGVKGELWLPPGGGVNFNESVEEALKREFREETGITIRVCGFLCINEFKQGDLHALELFFKVERIGGRLIKGADPELGQDNQIIKEVKFVTFERLRIMDNEKRHNILQGSISKENLLNMKGHFKLWQ